ncbi:MAG: TonB-dependent receptor [Bacteroidales bacterium]|nr:TonB-dependent receptor [Bacteroidales bacterium]MCF8390830.1 TonB-dependent receptor [Bacteroidales bacterium]
MNSRASILFLLLFFGYFFNGVSQDLVNITGKVVDKKTGEAIIGAAVNLKEFERWTVTNDKGIFEFKNIASQTYTLQVRCLCYELYSSSVDLNNAANQEILVNLIPTSFDMEEVNVLAKKGSNITTTTNIGSAAIEYVQATNLNDIMQLLPGNIAENPDLSKSQQISMREIGTDDNTAMGVSIIVDNSPISNDANLQTFSTTSSREDGFTTVVGTGVDLRQISTNNIESVEVIKGIPSVVYGNLTSGAVVVTTKAGKSPYAIKLKTDPNIKEIAFNKGIQIPSTNSFLNFDFDYVSSFADVTSKYKGFKRATGQIAYSNVFLKASTPLSFNTKLSYFGTIDNEKTDPDALVANEEYRTEDQGVKLNIYGSWDLKKKLISNLKYTFSLSYSHQESYQKMYRTSSGGVEAISLSLVDGENYGIFLPTEQLTELTIDGKPVDVFAQITYDKFMSFENGIINKLLFGGEYSMNGNYGDGQIYNIANPPFISNRSSRPRSFKDIPSLQDFSLYLEDKLIVPIKETNLSIQGGARLNNYQPSGLFSSEVGFYFEPRFNIQYNLLNKRNNQVFDLLSFNFGIGKTYKSPSLVYLYPDKAYYDLPVLDFYVADPNINTAVFNSMSFNTENPELKPYENLKKELGMDFTIGSVSGNITAFKENLTNGYEFESVYEFINGYKYLTDSIPVGEKPDISKLPIEYYDYIISYSSPINNQKTIKSGVEFSFNFGKIKSLYTSFTLDGAWLKTTRFYSTIDYNYLPSSASSVQYSNIGVYPAGESKISERLNTSLRMVSQIPHLRMILSTTIQMIWFDKYYYPYYDEAPLYLFDKDGNTIEFTDEMRTDPDFMRYVDERSDFYYLTEIMPPLFLANFRLSKEIADKMKLSLFVNNFLNYRPMYQYVRSESYTRRNPSIYFGAEVKFNL